MNVCDVWMECKRECGDGACIGVDCVERNDLKNRPDLFEPKDPKLRDSRGWYKRPLGITTQYTTSRANKFVCLSCGEEIQVKIPRMYTMAKVNGFKPSVTVECVCGTQMTKISDLYRMCGSCGYRHLFPDGIIRCFFGRQINLGEKCRYSPPRYKYGSTNDFPLEGDVIVVDE